MGWLYACAVGWMSSRPCVCVSPAACCTATPLSLLILTPPKRLRPQPQDAYGLEKLATEELCKHYNKDFGIECRIARFHNIYGPHGTWKGGREKAPAAFCRKVLTSTSEIEMWGDGKQTRSFTFIDDCVEGILRITKSDFRDPLNLGSTEMVSMNGMMELAMSFDDKKLPIKHIPGPEGVRGRNSDNKLILEKLGWEPTVTLADGLKWVWAWACFLKGLRLRLVGNGGCAGDGVLRPTGSAA